MIIKKDLFDKTADNQQIFLYSLTNPSGIKAKIINYGAILLSLEVPDRKGKIDDITLGYDDLDGYINDNCYFGATVGRFANRIAKGKFSLKGTDYCLATNDAANHLHGGIKGFNKATWNISEAERSVKLTYISKDGEEGYPGNLTCTVTYTLTNADELKIAYEAQTDKPTIVNLTHHSYFNLAGQGNGDILAHQLTLNADSYTPVDDELIPTGKIENVAGSPLDFTHPKIIGTGISSLPNGYDHNFIINAAAPGEKLTFAARITEPKSGRAMEIYTTQPGIQFYSGNFLDGALTGKAGKVYNKHYGFCLETQHWPDSPNKHGFPTTLLEPGDRYTHEVVHKFYTT